MTRGRIARNASKLAGGVGAILLASIVVVLAGHAHKAHTDSGAALQVERAVVQDVNSVRARHGLRPVAARPALTRAARAHTRDMLDRQVFAHGAVWQRLGHFGVRVGALGENLAWSAPPSGAATRLVEAWLRSPEHREVMLDPRFSEIGVGAARGDFLGHENAVVVTADFHGSA